MSRIRVVQLVAGIAIGEQSGGAEQIALHVARLLDGHEFESIVFAMRGYGSSVEKRWQVRLAEEGIPVHGLLPGTGAPLWDMRRALDALWTFVNEYQPDLINSHSERGDALNAFLRVLHPRHPRAVRTMHTDQQWQTRPNTGMLLTQAVFPCVFDAEIAVSQSVHSALAARPLAQFIHRSYALCYEGIDAELFDIPPTSREEASLPPSLPKEHPRIGIVGRLAWQKGHTFLLQAMPLIQQVSPVHLIVIGSGELEQELQRECTDLGIESCVHFLGSRDDVQSIIPHLDVLVSASLWEGLPAVILEAMALSVPVVATDVSGSREVVQAGRTGRLVPVAQPSALAQAILETLADPIDAKRMAENARSVATRFTVQNATPCYAQVYREVVIYRAGPSRRSRSA